MGTTFIIVRSNHWHGDELSQFSLWKSTCASSDSLSPICGSILFGTASHKIKKKSQNFVTLPSRKKTLMIYKIRIILDAQEDIFRDIEIDASNSMEEFHNAIAQSFGFLGNEMASFYTCDNEWNQDEEIALFDMSETGSDVRLMNETFLEDVTIFATLVLLYNHKCEVRALDDLWVKQCSLLLGVLVIKQ